MAETTVFATGGLPRSKRFEAWKASVGLIFDVRRGPALPCEDFDVRVASVMFDGLVLNRVRAGAQEFSRPTARFAADGLDHYMVQLFLSGGVRMRRGSRTIRGRAGTLVGFDLAETLDSVNEDFELLSLFIPRRRLAPLLSSPDSVHGRTARADSGAGRLIADYLTSLHRNAPRMDAREAAVAADVLLRLCALTLDGPDECEGDPPGWADHAILVKARRVMSDRAFDPDLDPSQIAAAAGVSRTRLYEAFRPIGGVAETLREIRLRRCFSDLLTSSCAGLQVAEIGYRWGFTDPSAFSRAFRTRFGMSPRDLRAQPERRTGGPGSIEGLDHSYEHWIASLA